VLTGGGALLKTSTSASARRLACPSPSREDPLASVVMGTGRMLSDFKLLRQISID